MAIPWAGQLQRVAVWQATYPAAYQLELASLWFTWFTSLCFALARFGLFRFALVWLAHRRRPHYICRREDNNGHLVFGIRHWQLVTGNCQLATCSGVGRFYFYRYCLTIFPVGVAVGRSRAWVQSASPGCALSLLCGCSNHHHFCCCFCCCCCFVRYSLGDIFWVSASGKSAVKGQLAARRSQQTSAFCQGAGRFVCQRNKQIKVSKCLTPRSPSPTYPSSISTQFGIVFCGMCSQFSITYLIAAIFCDRLPDFPFFHFFHSELRVCEKNLSKRCYRLNRKRCEARPLATRGSSLPHCLTASN